MLREESHIAGESRAVAGFGGSGAVSFDFVASGATVFAPEDADRAAMIEALGRALDASRSTNSLHQLLPKKAIHDSKDRDSYEGNSPALIAGILRRLALGHRRSLAGSAPQAPMTHTLGESHDR